MRLIFEHIIVNGYVIDVYGEVGYKLYMGDAEYYCDPHRFVVTKNGFPVSWDSFCNVKKNLELFWFTLTETEDKYQEYLEGIHHGY